MSDDPLRRLRAPGEDEAAGRAWSLVREAHRGRGPRRPRGRRRRVAAVAVCVLAVVLAATPTAGALAGWVQRTVRQAVGVTPGPPPRTTALDALPGGGRVLVLTGAGTPAVGGDLSARGVAGVVDEAEWSPRGRFVITASGRTLAAVGLQGERRWSVTAAATVQAPRWSPDGFRVAYLAGDELRVVAGDGTGDGLLAPRVTRRARDAAIIALQGAEAVAPAWRPGPGHVLAYAARDGDAVVLDADFGTLLARVPAPAGLRELHFSAAGDRLILLGDHELVVAGGRSGRVLGRMVSTSRLLRAVPARTGRDVAVVRQDGPHMDVALVGDDGRRSTALFAGARVGRIAFSPDGRWLLVDWRETDTWLFLPLGDPADRRTRTLPDAGRAFGAADVQLVGWCCPPAG